VKVDGIIQSLEPVRLGQLGVSEHGMGLVQQSAVQTFHHAVVLWCIGSGDFMLDATFFKILLDVIGHVFTSSI